MPPRLARLLAVVAAVALVGGAFVVRGALSGDDGGGGSGGGGGGGPEGGSRVICDDDLGPAACEALGGLDGVDAVEVMTADEALTALTEEVPPWDAWATLDPWPEIVDVARDEAGLPPLGGGEGEPLSASPLAVLTGTDDGVDCPAPVAWTCLIDAAPDAFVGVPTLTSAAGPLVLGAAALGLVGPDAGIADLRAGEVRAQLTGLLDSARDRGSLAQEAGLATQPGRYDALVTTAGLATATATTSQGEQLGLERRDLEPAATVGVVLAPLGPDGPGALDRLRDQVTDQTVLDGLGEAGWTSPPAPSSGLPDPDLIYALDEEFSR